MTTPELRRELFGSPIQAVFTPLDQGIHILLTGGERTHVGAVSMARNGKLLFSAAFPAHREQVISDRWAIHLSRKTKGDVTVNCGIHYDNVSADQIKRIVACADELLAQALEL